MEKWRKYPVLYEINTWVWLNELSARVKRQVTLGSVPEEELERLAGFRFDGLWLMGVWKRSPGSRELARTDPALIQAYKQALPDYRQEDVVGSPYAIYGYNVDPVLGGDEGLASLRERLSKLGLRVVLDFVPNHLAVDHPWLSAHPDRFVGGQITDLERQPGNYFSVGNRRSVFAHGKDPNFPGWTDTTQLDYRREDTRRAMTETLRQIAARCDGVRCDMAMLVMRDVFLRTWGGEFEPAGAEFWPAAIQQVKQIYPDFMLLAEVYWDLEYAAQMQGFDFVYDKRLYDRLVNGDVWQIRGHLQAAPEYQARLLRFVENHDEQRARALFGPRSQAAATLTLALPGLRLLHDGQMEGRLVRTPVQLGRRSPEGAAPELERFYQKLLEAVADPVFHQGEWRLLEATEAWAGNASDRNFVVYCWLLDRAWRLLAINFGPNQSQCLVPLAIPDLAGSVWQLHDLLSDVQYERSGGDLLQKGLYLDMAGYKYHLFEFQPKKLPPGPKVRHTVREHGEPVHGIALSPDGKTLAMSGSHSKKIWLVDTEDGCVERTLEGHVRTVDCVAWSPDGRRIASGSDDRMIRIWNLAEGSCRPMHGHQDNVLSVDWSPDGRMVASGSIDRMIGLWNPESATSFWPGHHGLAGHTDSVNSVAWSPDGRLLASGSGDHTVRLWEVGLGRPSVVAYRELLASDWVSGVAWSPDGKLLAAGTGSGAIHVWDEQGHPVIVREGHTGRVLCVAFGAGGRLLASKAADGTVRLWKTGSWEELAVLEESGEFFSGVVFHPTDPVLITRDDRTNTVRVWDFDPDVLLGATPLSASVQYTTAKIALVGDQGVGKTGLGWRLAHNDFRPPASTHGEQFWISGELGTTRADGTQCEAVLWDFAGQPDYRLIHALFLDDIHLALIVFDAANREQPLKGVDYWVKQLSRRKSGTSRSILIAQRIDVSGLTVTTGELDLFCKERGISGGHASTSALRGDGVDDLKRRIRDQVPWDDLTATVTTLTFKRIKECVLTMKQGASELGLLIDPIDLRKHFQAANPDWSISDDEIMAAIRHLANHGYVRLLKASVSQESVLLAPDLLINLAASFVLEARRDPHGLGVLDENRLLRGDYSFPELAQVRSHQQQILLDTVTTLFLEHNICFRELLGNQSLLVFPGLINQKRPGDAAIETTDGASYMVTGVTENVYAALVVLLGYTNTFTRTDQWQNQAQYEMDTGQVCGFRQAEEREGEIELVLYYGPDTPDYVRGLFEGLFEKFLRARSVTVYKYPPMECPHCDYLQARSEVIGRTKRGEVFMFCSNCGHKIALPKPGPAIEIEATKEQQKVARRRTAYEAALVQIKRLVARPEKAPTCFLSYAWGDRQHEEWVRNLAGDLRGAGIEPVLDREREGAISSIPRFLELSAETDFVACIGTPAYKQKYKNEDPTRASKLAAELDIINQRLTNTEEKKRTVIPLLREGEAETSLTPLLLVPAYIDFRDQAYYFAKLAELVLRIHRVPLHQLDLNKLIEGSQ